jgi:hypothetical protein
LGRSWMVAMGPGGLRLDADGRTVLATDAPAVLRNLDLGDRSLSCRIHATGPVRPRAEHPLLPRRIEVDDKSTTPEGPWIRVPPGWHTLRITAPLLR